MSPPPRPGAAPPGSSDSELSWQELLRTPLSLSLSSDDQPPGGSLDARVLLRLVDQRCRADLRNLQAQAAAASEELAAVRRDSLASIATLAQRWQSQPGLGAFTLAKGVEEARRAAAERVAGAPDLDALSARVAEAAASVRRRASDTGRTLARGWDAGPGAPGGAGAPWDVWRTLDANLRSLELSVREGLDKPRKQQPLPTRRRAAKAAGQQEPVRVCPE